MDVDRYLRLTPPEINIKILAWNDKLKGEALRDYRAVLLIRDAIITSINKEARFPDFERFYPEKTATGNPIVHKNIEKAMNTAKAVGHI